MERFSIIIFNYKNIYFNGGYLLKKYFEDSEYNAAFDRCIDVLSHLIMKYGPKVLDVQEREKQVSTSNVSKNSTLK